MRPSNIGTVTYSPNEPPNDPALLPAWWRGEQIKIKAAIDALAAGRLEPTYVAPPKPREGDWRNAAGAPYWDPGSGKGFYRFDGDTNTWIYLG